MLTDAAVKMRSDDAESVILPYLADADADVKMMLILPYLAFSNPTVWWGPTAITPLGTPSMQSAFVIILVIILAIILAIILVIILVIQFCFLQAFVDFSRIAVPTICFKYVI